MKILFVQPSLDPPGGGNLVACWMMQALVADHEVTLLSWTRPDLERCNRHYGTSLVPGDFALHTMARPLALTMAQVPLRMRLFRDALLTRRARRLREGHDLAVTANNEMDLAGEAIQYVHHPDTVRAFRHDRAIDPPHTPRPVSLYFRLCDRLGGASLARMRANLTLVNSEWMRDVVAKVHSIAPRVVYPPVPPVLPVPPSASPARSPRPPDSRRDAVIAAGRFSPEKRFEAIVEIVARVRAGGHPLGLTIAAFDDDRGYRRRIRALCARHRDWVRLVEEPDREALGRLLSTHRYGIHAMVDEHFGIAVAEMMAHGCIPFVRAGGGPSEIVGPSPELVYESTSDAAAKIGHVVADAALERSLAERLRRRAPMFSSERFCREIRALVARHAVVLQ